MGLAETLCVRMITAVAPTDSSLYVGYSSVTADRAFLFRSHDGGASFTELNDSQLCSAQCGYNIAMAVNPINPNELFFWRNQYSRHYRRWFDLEFPLLFTCRPARSV